MVNNKLLRKIQEKHPEYSIHQIRSIISKHWQVFNLKMCKAQIVDLTINKLGTIHTNRNIIKISYVKALKKSNKASKLRIRYSDESLLF